MKRHKKSAGAELDRFFARSAKPTREQLDLSRRNVLLRLSSPHAETLDEAEPAVGEARQAFRPFLALAATAAMLCAVAGAALVFRNIAPHADRPAIAEAVAGTLYRVSGSESRPVRTAEKIASGVVVRSDRDQGAVLGLADGSRIEMRSRSELALEETGDGVRIRLATGSVIVNAAKQRTGHLYVQTRDVTVSVVGTVFLVESAETGSRVAVIQGEVHVQQGSMSKKLLPGEQVITAPSLAPLPVAEEISWSRNVEAHLALLQQAIAFASSIAPQNRQPRQTFESVSIVAREAPQRVRGGRGGGAAPALAGLPFGQQECTGRAQLNSNRLTITNTNLYGLIASAYGMTCRDTKLAQLISGGPAWVTSERFDVDVTIPDGTPSYTQEQFNNHEAPVLQVMLQTMLADRFRLVVRRETKETPVYNLIVVNEARLKPAEDNPSDRGLPPQMQTMRLGPDFVSRGMILGGGTIGMIIDESGLATIRANRVRIPAIFTLLYTQLKDRLIVDRTNLQGRYDLQLQFAAMQPVAMVSQPTLPAAPAGAPLFDAIQEQLGLKLDAARVPMEVIVIDRAERPPQN